MKQKEDKVLNKNVTTLHGDSDQAKSLKSYKGPSQPSHVVAISSSSSSSSGIKDSPSGVRSRASGARSHQKQNFELVIDVDNHTESVEHDIHSTMLQDVVNVSTAFRTPIRTSDKELCSETDFSKTASCGKQKIKKKKINLSSKKTNNSDSRGKSLCMETELIREAFLEESTQEKKHSRLFQRNGIYSPSAKGCVGSLNDETKCGFETGTTGKSSVGKPSDKITTILNESTNAFHILMSSRTLQSPCSESVDETADHVCPDKRKTGITVAETLMKTAAVKENRKKRKKILEDLAERQGLKKAKLSYTSTDIKLEKIPTVRCKRLVIVSESDSDNERNVGLCQDTDTFKVKDDDKHVHGECGQIFLEENGEKSIKSCNEKKHDRGVSCGKCDATTLTRMDRNGSKLLHEDGRKLTVEETANSCSKHQKKQDKVINQESLHNNKLKHQKKQDKVINQESLHNNKLSARKLDRSRNSLVHKNSSKVLVGEITNDCSGLEKDHIQLKELVIKVEKLSAKKCLEYSDSVHKGRTKSVVYEKEQVYESEAIKIKKEGSKRGSKSEDRKVNYQLSVDNTEMPSQLPTTTKMFVTHCNKTPFKCYFQQGVKTLGKGVSDHQNNGKRENDAEKNELWIEEDSSEEESHEQKEFPKEDKTNKAFTVTTVDSKCEMLTEPKKHLTSPDETKKRSSLFSYFNKVSKDEVPFKPEKITVKVQVHSPPVSSLVENRRTSVVVCKREQRRHRVQSKVLDLADQIMVLESHIVKPAADDSAVSVTPPKESKAINNSRTSSSSSGWKMRVRLRELPVQAPSESDTGTDFIYWYSRFIDKCTF
jgi:hypothetical protein